MAGADLEAYMTKFMDPTILDFVSDPTSVRHAFLSCVVVFHAVDYAAHADRDEKKLAQEWRAESAAFATVSDVANAFKHVVRRKPSTPQRAEEVVRKRGVFDAAFFDPEIFDVGGVTFEHDPSVDVLGGVQEAAAFVRSKLQAEG